MKRIIAVLCLIVAILTQCFAVMAEDINLTIMSRQELEDLKERIDQEIVKNHMPDSQIEKVVLALTKEMVTSVYDSDGYGELSWPWFDYKYTNDWGFYTLKTDISYKINKQKHTENVYTEAYPENGEYALFYLQVGDEILLDRRDVLANEDEMIAAILEAMEAEAEQEAVVETAEAEAEQEVAVDDVQTEESIVEADESIDDSLAFDDDSQSPDAFVEESAESIPEEHTLESVAKQVVSEDRLLAVHDLEREVQVFFVLANGWNNAGTVSRFFQEATDICEGIADLLSDEHKTVYIQAKTEFVDKYGVVSTGKAITLTLSSDTIRRVNWDNKAYLNIEELAEDYWIHNALRN